MPNDSESNVVESGDNPSGKDGASGPILRFNLKDFSQRIKAERERRGTQRLLPSCQPTVSSTGSTSVPTDSATEDRQGGRRLSLVVNNTLSITESDSDVIPDTGSIVPQGEEELDAELRRLSVITAYEMFCGKQFVDAGNRTEGIKVRCPIPGHEDKDPSAWINTVKNVWHCGACEQGGDIFDLGAYHFGYPVPGYKDDRLFRSLRDQIAAALGYVKMSSGGAVLYIKDDEVEEEEGKEENGKIAETASGNGTGHADNISNTVSDSTDNVGNVDTDNADSPIAESGKREDPSVVAVSPGVTTGSNGGPARWFVPPLRGVAGGSIFDASGQMVGGACDALAEHKAATDGTCNASSSVTSASSDGSSPSDPADSPDSDSSDNATGTEVSNVTKTPEAIAAEIAAEEQAILESIPPLDWKNILPVNTFLRKWMEETTKDTCPEEFHFWLGMQALGFAVGRHRVLFDNPQIVSNLFVCLVGRSGSGKSRAKRHLTNLLTEYLPYVGTDPFTTGTKASLRPSSGEMLIKHFSHPVCDPQDPKKILTHSPVRGLVDFDELSTLVGKTARKGSVLKEYLMELYDAPSQMSSDAITSGSQYAFMPFGQAVTTAQPSRFKSLISADDDASGFINRWVFAVGQPKPRVFLNTVKVDLSGPGELIKEIHKWAGTSVVLEYSSDALAGAEKFYKESVWKDQDESETNTDSDILGRLDLLIKKLMLLFAVNEMSSTVELRHLTMAVSVYQYLLATYGKTGKLINTTVQKDLWDNIISIFQKQATSGRRMLLAKDIYRSIAHRKRDPDLFKKTLDLMVNIGILTVIETQGETLDPKTGKPKRQRIGKRYSLVA